MNKKIKLGVSGEAGSFSEAAGLNYAQKMALDVELIYLHDMERVLSAVQSGTVDLGIFPVVNLRGGLVKMAFTAMAKHVFTLIDDLWLNVQQCLLVQPGVKLSALKAVVSHPQGLLQCEHFLQSELSHAERIEWTDTAQAAKDLASGKLSPENAVIAPERAAALYGLEVLAKNIQDNSPNWTIFIIVQRNET